MYITLLNMLGVLIFSSDLLDDTSVDLFWEIVLSTCEKSPPSPPPSLLRRSFKIAQNYELMKL